MIWKLVGSASVIALVLVATYSKGVSNERYSWEEKVRAEAAKNSSITQKVDNSVEKVGEAITAKNKIRIQKEIVYKDRIEMVIKDNPIYSECKIDKEVLDAQNSLKALGPKP